MTKSDPKVTLNVNFINGGIIMMKKNLMLLSVFIFAFLLWTTEHSLAEQKLKVFISVDMEGIAGIVHSEQTSTSGKDYNIARKWMTGEVNAAIKGALEAGATEIVVNDSHGSMRNIIASELHPSAYLITGSPKPLSMMQGIDETFDAVILIGYHASAGTKDGVLDHTISSGRVSSIKVNDIEMNEAELNALIAGSYDVPVVLIVGDAAVCNQTRKILGDELEVAIVKEAVGRHAAKTLTPKRAQELIYERTMTGLEKRDKINPFKMDPPYRFELNYLSSYMADAATLVPQVKRVGGRAVSFEIDDYIQGFKLLRALISLAR